MSTATASAEPPETQVSNPDHPIAIGDIFGWLTPGYTRRAVVLCGTYGYEQHCAHRPWRQLAHHIASTGCTTVRFDYPGAGDSGDAAPKSVRSWIAAIRQVVTFLREEAEIDEIVLVGFRLGGTLAVLAAEGLDIERIVLLAPFPTGRAYVREAILQARMVNVLPNGEPMPEPAGTVAVGGFALDPALVSELVEIDLTRSDRPPARHVLQLGSERGGLAAHYRRLGAAVVTAPFPDLAQLCANAMHSRCSAATLATVAAFASDGPPSRSASMPTGRRIAPARIEGPHWSEDPVRFGAGIAGVLCRPKSGAARATVLFLNMGLDVHSGFGRQTTDLARALALAGIQSLRMDLRGAGDSADRPEGRFSMYDLKALDDVGAALASLSGRQAGPLIVTGTCHGAYLALHAACRDARIDAAVLVNLYCFDWEVAHGDVPFSERSVRSLGGYFAVAKHGQAWRRLLDGQTGLRRIAAVILAQMIRALTSRLLDVIRGTAGRTSIPDRVAHLRKRGARLALLYSADDLGLVDLRKQFGSSASRLAQTFGRPVCIVQGADHAFSASHARAELLDTLVAVATECQARPAPCRAEARPRSSSSVRPAVTAGPCARAHPGAAGSAPR